MGDKHDRRGRAAGHDRDEILEGQPAATGDVGLERVAPDDEAVGPELVDEPLRSRWSTPAVPGDRSGAAVARSTASCVAPTRSKAAGSAGRGSAAGRVTVKAASRSGNATKSQVPR